VANAIVANAAVVNAIVANAAVVNGIVANVMGRSQPLEEGHLPSYARPCAAALLVLALASRVAGEDVPQTRSLSLQASVVTYPAKFKKYLYSFPLPGAVMFKGLTGNVSTGQPLSGFSEALISLHELPSGRCPQNGEVYDSYEEVRAKYPHARGLANFILKNPDRGVSTLQTQFTLPVGIPISNCAIVILDGSIVTGGPFTMKSDMTLIYSNAPSPPSIPQNAPQIIGLDDEFCFGQSWGCQVASVDTSQSFAKVVAITSRARLLALYGDISDSSFALGGRLAPPPDGVWSMANDFYAIRGCAGMPQGLVGPGHLQIPAGATTLLNVTMHGKGRGTLQQPVFKEFTDVTLEAGDCIAHVVKMDGHGGVDAECQVFALVVPD
jgi:hypothetical protein